MVINQDIIIPNGITVDMDMDVQFNGLLNSFSVAGILTSTNTDDLEIVNGTLIGSGSITLNKITLSGALATYSFTGPITVDVFTNAGSVVSLTSQLTISDTLDLEGGFVTMNSGSVLQLMPNSNVRVNSGVLTNSGGTFVTGVPYDVWYYGSTKVSGEEINSAHVRNLNLLLSSNAMNLVLSGNCSVNEDLVMTAGHIVLNGNRLSLQGDLVRDSGSIFEASGASDLEIAGFAGAMTNGLEFAPNSTLDQLIISRDTSIVHLINDVTITGRLELEAGDLMIDSSAILSMAAGSAVARYIGGLEVDGTFDGTQQYNAEYLGDSLTTGAELSGTGLNNVLVNLSLPYRLLYLSQNLTVPGSFNLVNGQFVLDTFDLRLDGTFDQESDAEIWGSLDSKITLSMASSVNDTLWMRPQAYPIAELVLDIPTASTITLGASVLMLKLSLLSGKIDVGNSILKIGGITPTIVGASDTRYVVTNGWGYLMINVTANDPYMEFPIGTATMYSPAAIRQTGAGTTGYMWVRVIDGVWTNGVNGTDVSTSQAVVNKTWLVQTDSAMIVNMDLRVGWLLACESNGFDRTNCFVKNYYNNAWDSDTPTLAAPGSFNTYTVERFAIPNFGDFAVVDASSPLVVQENVNLVTDVYPNPTIDFVNVAIVNPANDNLQYEIYDAAGRLVTSFQNANASNQIDMRNYDNGSYTLRVTNTITNEVTTRLIIKS